MPYEQLGEPPEYIAKKAALRQEVRDIVAALEPKREAEQLPDGYFNRSTTEYVDDVPVTRHTASDSEFAEHLASLGIYRSRRYQN